RGPASATPNDHHGRAVGSSVIEHGAEGPVHDIDEPGIRVLVVAETQRRGSDHPTPAALDHRGVGSQESEHLGPAAWIKNRPRTPEVRGGIADARPTPVDDRGESTVAHDQVRGHEVAVNPDELRRGVRRERGLPHAAYLISELTLHLVD